MDLSSLFKILVSKIQKKVLEYMVAKVIFNVCLFRCNSIFTTESILSILHHYILNNVFQDEHEAVAETAVVGYPHDIKGEGMYCTAFIEVLPCQVNDCIFSGRKH